MFNNDRYGNMLTIILIVSVVAIVGILGIVGVRIYNAYYVETGATQAATKFEEMIQNNNNNNNISSNNQIDTEKMEITGIDQDMFNNIISSGGGTSGQTVTKYKGFIVAGTIQIPAISLKYPILEKLSATSLKTSVVLMYTAQGINEPGNTVIIGHNYRNGTMFSDVDKLNKGDVIIITDLQGRKVRYKIYDKFETTGSDSEYITRNTNGKREISLSTCTDDSKGRTIVLAKEE